MVADGFATMMFDVEFSKPEKREFIEMLSQDVHQLYEQVMYKRNLDSGKPRPYAGRFYRI